MYTCVWCHYFFSSTAPAPAAAPSSRAGTIMRTPIARRLRSRKWHNELVTHNKWQSLLHTIHTQWQHTIWIPRTLWCEHVETKRKCLHLCCRHSSAMFAQFPSMYITYYITRKPNKQLYDKHATPTHMRHAYSLAHCPSRTLHPYTTHYLRWRGESKGQERKDERMTMKSVWCVQVWSVQCLTTSSYLMW